MSRRLVLNWKCAACKRVLRSASNISRSRCHHCKRVGTLSFLVDLRPRTITGKLLRTHLKEMRR